MIQCEASARQGFKKMHLYPHSSEPFGNRKGKNEIGGARKALWSQNWPMYSGTLGRDRVVSGMVGEIHCVPPEPEITPEKSIP